MKLVTGIEIWMAPPRTGKSTMGAWLARKHLKAGYNVYTNYPVHGCRKLEPKKDLLEYNLEHALIIIDEAWEDFDNRDWKNFSKKCMEFFKTHGHYHLRVILFSQCWDDVDVKIRKLAIKIVALEKSYIPGFVKSKKIKPTLDISEEGEIVYKYHWQKWYAFGTRYYFVVPVWKMFDSWSRKPLPEKEWETWIVDGQIKQKIKKESKSFVKDLIINVRSKIKKLLSRAK